MSSSRPGAGAPILYLEGRSERQWRWLGGPPCVSARFSASPASEMLPSALYMLWAMPTILHPNNVSPRSVPSSDCSAGAVAQRDRHPDGEPTLHMENAWVGPYHPVDMCSSANGKLESPKFQGFSKFKSNPPNKQLRFTLPETNSKSPWKSKSMLEDDISFWVSAYFEGLLLLVSYKVCDLKQQVMAVFKEKKGQEITDLAWWIGCRRGVPPLNRSLHKLLRFVGAKKENMFFLSSWSFNTQNWPKKIGVKLEKISRESRRKNRRNIRKHKGGPLANRSKWRYFTLF